MIPPGFGDLAQQLPRQRLSVTMRRDIERLTTELSTGQVADLGHALRGDHARLAAIDSARAAGLATRNGAREIASQLELMQAALQRIDAPLVDLANNALTAGQTGGAGMLVQVAGFAREIFADTVAALNTSAAGRSLFAGTRSDGPALAAPDILFGALAVAVSGAPDAQALADSVRTWFAPGGEFDQTGYLGGAPAQAPLRLGKDIEIDPAPTANDPVFRDILAALALGALSTADPPGLDTASRSDIARAAGEDLHRAQRALIRSAETIGRAESRTEMARIAAESALTSLDIARTRLLEADPYITASRLEDTLSRLEALYMITARSARLSLAEYLR